MLCLQYGPTLTSVHDCWKVIALIILSFVRKVKSLLLLYLNCLTQKLCLSLSPVNSTSYHFPFPSKGRQNILAPCREKPITGRGKPFSVFTCTSWTQTKLRALAREFSKPSQDPAGLAKELELTIRIYKLVYLELYQ